MKPMNNYNSTSTALLLDKRPEDQKTLPPLPSIEIVVPPVEMVEVILSEQFKMPHFLMEETELYKTRISIVGFQDLVTLL